jgi:hypothetical protein
VFLAIPVNEDLGISSRSARGMSWRGQRRFSFLELGNSLTMSRLSSSSLKETFHLMKANSSILDVVKEGKKKPSDR